MTKLDFDQSKRKFLEIFGGVGILALLSACSPTTALEAVISATEDNNVDKLASLISTATPEQLAEVLKTLDPQVASTLAEAIAVSETPISVPSETPVLSETPAPEAPVEIKETEALEEIVMMGDFKNYFDYEDNDKIPGLSGGDKPKGVVKGVNFLNNKLVLYPKYFGTEWSVDNLSINLSSMQFMQNETEGMFVFNTEGMAVSFESGIYPIINIISDIPIENQNNLYRTREINISHFSKNKFNLEDVMLMVRIGETKQGVSVGSEQMKNVADYALHLASRKNNQTPEIDQDKMDRISVQVVAMGLRIADPEMVQRYFEDKLTNSDIAFLRQNFSDQEWEAYKNAQLDPEEVKMIQGW